MAEERLRHIIKLSDNIISPLGDSSEANLRALLAGESKLQPYNQWGLPDTFVASFLDREHIDELTRSELRADVCTTLTFFEKLCILSAQQAINDAGIDASDKGVVFVLSTTKGNVELIRDDRTDSRAYLSRSADVIARYFGNPNTPIVISNACISGVCAQITATRMLKYGDYTTAVVIGCDVLSKFIVSGFMSFKALSPEVCRPYDKDRVGLNLGEAAATMVLSVTDNVGDNWCYRASAIRNDANHISGPSRTGEGSYRVLKTILNCVSSEELAVVNTHGTATAYNDEMESIALHRAGLDGTPVNALKGFYGHTLGAAGVLETILSMRAIEGGIILPTRGYDESGVTYTQNISHELRHTDKRSFIKLLSGFGGCNAGIAYTKGGAQ